MKTALIIFALSTFALLLISAVILTGATVVDMRLAHRRQLSETYQTLAYACGYLAGQRAVVSRLPSVFGDYKGPPDTESCPAIRALAAQHGFTDRQ